MTTIPNTLDTFNRRDAALLQQLGLRSANLELSVQSLLGTVEMENGVQVSVWATSTPAVFFHFEFYFPATGKRYRAQTGSGDFRAFWKIVSAFAKGHLHLQPDTANDMFEVTELAQQEAGGPPRPSSIKDILAEPTELFVECSRCETLYRFPLTKRQALRYYDHSSDDLIQDIFPELPLPVLAVLTEGNVCGLCLPQSDESVNDVIRGYVIDHVDLPETVTVTYPEH